MQKQNDNNQEYLLILIDNLIETDISNKFLS